MRFRKRIASWIVLVPVTIGAAPNPVHWSLASVPTKAVNAGATANIKLLAAIESGWHVYAMEQDEGGPVPLEVSLTEGTALSLGPVRSSKSMQIFDPNFDKRVRLYVGKAELSMPLIVASDAPSGPQHFTLKVRYQCCNDTMCLPPRSASMDAVIAVRRAKSSGQH